VKKALLLLAGLAVLPAAQACSTDWDITLETFGEGVTIELRSGVPGKSKVVATRKSHGGQVAFHKLCGGKYFLAIGNEEQVSVTPVRTFENNAAYSSSIVVQMGQGNVKTRSRSSL